jgi:type IV secretory pathway VirJ component
MPWPGYLTFCGAQTQEIPLILMPAGEINSTPLVLLLSGDGGWTSFTNTFANIIVKQGISVVGIDSRKYFWSEKTPDKAAADISAVITDYLRLWNKKTFILVGYSFGASVAPFVANRLPTTLSTKLTRIICFSPDEYASLEIHLSDMLNLGVNTGKYHVFNEIIKGKYLLPICVFGEDEQNSLKEKLPRAGIKAHVIPGGHRYNNDYPALIAYLTSTYHNKK